jgi:hypothetical protein
LDERRSCLFNGKEGDEIFLSSFQEDVKSNKNVFFLNEGKRECVFFLGMKNTVTYSLLSGMFSSMSRH